MTMNSRRVFRKFQHDGQPHPSEKSDNQDVRQMKHYSQTQREAKTAKLSKLRRKIDFLQRGMQRVRTKSDRLQQDPT